MPLSRVESRAESDWSLFLQEASEGNAGIMSQDDYLRFRTVIGVDIEEFGPVGKADDAQTWDDAIREGNASSDAAFVVRCRKDTSLPNGTTVDIDRNHFWVVMDPNVRVSVDDGYCFTWGTGASTTYNGGGLVGGDWNAATPETTQSLVKVDDHNNLTIADISLNTIMQVGAFDGAGGLFLRNIRGTTANNNSSVVFDLIDGSGLIARNLQMNVPSVTIPTDRSTASDGPNAIFMRFGQGSWDTAHVWGVTANRYGTGLLIEPAASKNVTNLWFNSVVLDYNKTNAIKINANASGQNIRTVKFAGGYFVAIDGHGVELAGATGSMKHVHFTDCVSREAGKNNWKLGSQVQEHVQMIGCHGLGANRLSANTGADQDDVYIQYDGVTIIGGHYGEDGQPYNSIAGNQGRYGITLPADTANTIIRDVELTGGTNDIQITAYTAAQNNVGVWGNTKTGAARPSYATTATVAAPTSGVQQTWYGPTKASFTFYGGTFTSLLHNGTTVSTGTYGHFTAHPNDTWTVTYSSAPTIRRVIHP